MAIKDRFEIDIGNAVSSTARFVALWWNAKDLSEGQIASGSLKLGQLPKSPGIYAITGRHDTHHSDGVLYIGKAEDLSSRLPVSIRDHLSEEHPGKGNAVYADVWCLTIRWAECAIDLLSQVERLQIMSHSPAFNSQGTRRVYAERDIFDLVVMNAGRKGSLLPVVAGAYQSPGWINRGNW